MHKSSIKKHTQYKDCIIYDSVLFSDGSYLVHQTKDTPQNGLTRYFDKKGRLIATNSFASETPSQVLVYAYDEKKRLKHLLRYNAQDQEDDFHDSQEYDYLPFRLAIEDIDFNHPDTTRHSLTSIIYDDHGNAKEAMEIPSGKTLVAPEGYKLNARVDPCTAFWESDLDGGQFFLKIDIVPISKPAEEYHIKRFVDFIPTFEEYYNNGQCDKIVCHPNPSHTYDKMETKIRLSGNNKNTYISEVEGDDHSKVDIWKNGRLLEIHWKCLPKRKRWIFCETVSGQMSMMRTKNNYNLFPVPLQWDWKYTAVKLRFHCYRSKTK